MPIILSELAPKAKVTSTKILLSPSLMYTMRISSGRHCGPLGEKIHRPGGCDHSPWYCGWLRQQKTRDAA